MLKLNNRRGVTLVELMVAMAIITIGAVGLMASFRFITRSIRISRVRTIANNLAQEKVESLKGLAYPMLLVTTQTVTDNNFNPALVYDAAAYAPETLALWTGVTFKRAVFVAYAAPSGTSISTVPYTSNDTGIKIIKVYVMWNQDGTWKNLSLTNLLENPSVSALDSAITGTVFKASGGGLASALVQVLGQPNWQTYTASDGDYTFNVAHGSYTVIASSAGYRSQTSGVLSASQSLSVTQNFTLTAIASGTVSSPSVYVSSNLVVSQVVASTITQIGDLSSHDIEYVELFNPTNSAVSVFSGGSRQVRLNYVGESGASSVSNISLVYVSNSVPANSYYLISNTTSAFVIKGTWVAPDAYYDPAVYGNFRDIILVNKAGAVQITDSASNIIDGLGWSHNGSGINAPWSEGSAVPQTGGIAQGDQIVRMSSACAPNGAYGRAYDSNDNGNNFVYNTGAPGTLFSFAPLNSATSQPVISGVPAIGGFASANDALSSAAVLTTANNTIPAPYNQTCPKAVLTLVGVATGTWTVQVSTGNYSQQVTGVSVANGATTLILNGATTPADSTGLNYLPITTPASGGYIAGTVTDPFGTPLSGISVSGAGVSTVTGANGSYMLNASTGTVIVTVNANQQNPNYISASNQVTVALGQTTVSNFTLPQGGTITGNTVNASNAPLAGIVVNASNNNGSSHGSAASDATGTFYITNLTTGTYTVAPALDASQSSVPSGLTASLTTPGSTVAVGTFTVTGAFATIQGSVSNTNGPITTGVLVIASSSTLGDPPPAIYASTSAANALYYAASSMADGTYNVLVRGSTSYTYTMRAYYPVVDPTSGSTTYSSKTRSGLSVGPGAAVTGVNFSWP